MNIMEIIKDFETGCTCGKKHETTIRDIVIESGAVHRVGEILKKNGFEKNLLMVADKNTLAASEGIFEALSDFSVEKIIYENQRVARYEQVEQIMKAVHGKKISIISVGTGSLNDICRVAAAREDKLFCIFATAPSMDGFASYGAPIVKGSFKATIPAKSPEVLIADTKILAAAPSELKSSGFGDMIAKYTGIVDWRISHIVTGEYYCEKIANLAIEAVDELMQMADRVTKNDEETAGKIFEALIKTGVAMSFTKNSRPASGSEHMIAHLMECFELMEDKMPNLHGEDVGVCTLYVIKYYHELASHEKIHAVREKVDWNRVYGEFGPMADDVRSLNTPDTVTDAVSPAVLEEKWGEIRDVIAQLPSYETCYEAMKKAGCKLTTSDIGKTPEFCEKCVRLSPYIRRRLTLLRMRDMIEL